jgi:hypothetical protein
MPSRASRPAPVELLIAFDRAVRVHRWRWYVFGAQAVVAYGRPRMTADVDVTVDVRGSAPGKLLAALAKHGFQARFPLDEASLSQARLLPLVHGPTHMPIDVVIAQRGLHQEFLRRARRVDIGGYEVPMIGVEDLIATKILAARRKDLEDVRGVLLEQWDAIDFDRLDAVLSLLERTLNDDRLKRRLGRLLRQVRKALG